jgi:hypothetical protein
MDATFQLKKRKKRLNVIQDDKPIRAVAGTTCFAEHKKHNVDCQRMYENMSD